MVNEFDDVHIKKTLMVGDLLMIGDLGNGVWVGDRLSYPNARLVKIENGLNAVFNSNVAAVAAKNNGKGPGVLAESANYNAVQALTGSNVAAVAAINTGKGQGIWAESAQSNGIHAQTGSDVAAVAAINTGKGQGIWAESAQSNGIHAQTGSDVAAVAAINTGKGQGIWAESAQSNGIHAQTGSDVAAVAAINTGKGPGIWAESAQSNGIHAQTGSDVAAVAAINTGKGPGIWAESAQSNGIHAQTGSDVAAVAAINTGKGPGIWAESAGSGSDVASVIAVNKGSGPGIRAESAKWNAIQAQSGSGVAAAVAAINTGGGPGIWAESKTGSGLAGHFEGNVEVTGDIILPNADCAEDFEISATERVDTGTVMTLNDLGQLEPGKIPYDKRVTGVVSGAGDLKPALILGRRKEQRDKLPIALMGRVNCRVDADYGPIEVGDLLTTSLTPGHAMKASDPTRAFGAIIGKAMRPLNNGRGLIPILVALQ